MTAYEKLEIESNKLNLMYDQLKDRASTVEHMESIGEAPGAIRKMADFMTYLEKLIETKEDEVRDLAMASLLEFTSS